MKHQQALSEAEVHKANIRAAQDWIEKNKARIKADADKTLLYSGRDYDVEKLFKDGKEIPARDRDTFMGTPVWKALERTRKSKVLEQIPAEFQTINDVLKSIRSHPQIIDRDRQEKDFAHADECYQELGRMPKLIPKRVVEACWSRMSEIFAANAKGHIKILDGCADDYTALKQDKDFIDKELPALLKNKDLSPEARKILEARFNKYASLFDRRYKEAIDKVVKARAVLKGK